MIQKALLLTCCLIAGAVIVLASLMRESLIISSDANRSASSESDFRTPGNENRPTDPLAVGEQGSARASTSYQTSLSPSQRNFPADNSRHRGINPQDDHTNQKAQNQFAQPDKDWSGQVPADATAVSQNISKSNSGITQAVPSQSLSSLATVTTASANSGNLSGGAASASPGATGTASSSQLANTTPSGDATALQDANATTQHVPSFDTPILYQIDQAKLAQMDPASASDIIYLESQYTDLYNTWAQQTPNDVKAWNRMVSDINLMVAQRVTDQTLSQLLKP